MHILLAISDSRDDKEPMASLLDKLTGKTSAAAVDDPDIHPDELKGAGIVMSQTDSRFKGGLNLENLTPDEREKLQNYRKEQLKQQ